MTTMTMTLHGAEGFQAQMRVNAKQVGPKTERLVRHYGQLLRTRVMAKASGRPGPNRVTGDYVRSWQLKVRGGGASTTAEVGTNAVQARRLENGFYGADSLGRVYSQPPYPHARPAFDEIAPQFADGAVKMMGDLAL